MTLAEKISEVPAAAEGDKSTARLLKDFDFW